MAMLNKYYNRSHISKAKFRQIIRLFTQYLPASKIADLSGISRVIINKLLLKIRSRLAHKREQASPFCGEIEVDESYFGARRVRGNAHISGIESFWDYAKRRLAMFNGVASNKFYLYLKECEDTGTPSRISAKFEMMDLAKWAIERI